MQAVAGIFGSIIGIIAAVISGAVVITVIVVLWKSEALPGLIELAGSLIGLAASGIAGFFSFLGDLLTFAGS
jgi:hypothetical protein